MTNLFIACKIMLQGMVGIFVVILLITAVVVLMGKMSKH